MSTASADQNKEIKVSIIVPARNEEHCIAACVRSLLGQAHDSYEVIVVDDASTDRTAEFAASVDARVKVVAAGPLPEGWMGKSHACLIGAQAAKGQWLLFTDADTVHAPHALPTALATAHSTQAALLSYSPRQLTGSWAEKILMPVVFAELATAYRPAEVSDPASPAAAANGQYLLVRAETYWSLRGHAAVASDLLEDVALARLVKASGSRIHFAYAGDLVQTRMYRSAGALIEGWTKNLFLLFPHPASLFTLRSVEQAALVIAFSLALTGASITAVIAAIIAALLLLNIFLRLRRANFNLPDTLFALTGTPFFLVLLLRSHIQGRLVRQIRWKGRVYGPGTAMKAAAAPASR